MSFQQDLRDRISKLPFKSYEKEVLKVVLGEAQQKSINFDCTHDQGYNIVRSMVKNNTEKVLPYLATDDSRRKLIEEENNILTSLLPVSLSKDEILKKIAEADLMAGIKGAKNEGQVIGLLMKHFKNLNLFVEGDIVKQVVQEIRAK